MGRPTNKSIRRKQIAVGLMKVMAANGYDGASIGDIAREAGLKPGLLHYHFANKEEILLEAINVIATDHAAGLESRLDQHPGDPTARLEAFVDFHLGLGADADPERLADWVFISGEALRRPAVRKAYSLLVSGWIDLAAKLIGDFPGGSSGVVEPRSTAAALIALIQGYFVLAAASPESIPRGSAAGCAKGMLNGLLDSAPFQGKGSSA